MKKLPFYLDELLCLFFPPLCITCDSRLNSQEEHICWQCWSDLPLSHFDHVAKNKVAQLFWGRVMIERATSFYQYRKGSRYQKLIHYIKYKGLKELGLEAGKRFALQLAETDFFKGIDFLVPVPLHPKKLKERGYNQSEWIALGLAAVSQIPVEADNLFRKVHTATQTRKSRYDRWRNVEGIFSINDPAQLEGRHILLVDDVVTTGSTLEACAWELLKIRGTRVSIATLAFAEY